jgi:hypothetical protein
VCLRDSGSFRSPGVGVMLGGVPVPIPGVGVMLVPGLGAIPRVPIPGVGVMPVPPPPIPGEGARTPPVPCARAVLALPTKSIAAKTTTNFGCVIRPKRRGKASRRSFSRTS